MATSRREPDGRMNRTMQTTSPGAKPSEPGGHGLRRARSVPSSPDRKLSPSPAAASSSGATRPSSSLSAFGSASFSVHGKTQLHTPSSSMAGAKAANTTRGKAGRSGGSSSLWPPALATHGRRSPKDMDRAARSLSSQHKSNLSPRPGIERTTAAASSPRLRAQKAIIPGAQGVSPVRAPATTTRKKTGVAASILSMQRTTSAPARLVEAPAKIDEQEVELLMEFDEMESISTPSIEEHLQERLPDPVELRYVDAIAHAVSHDDPSEPSSDQQDDKNEEVIELVSEEKRAAPDDDSLNEGDDAGVGKEAIDETELKEDANETESNEVVSKNELHKDVNATKLTKDAAQAVLIEKKEAKANVEMAVPPTKLKQETVQGWTKDDERSNEVKQEGRSKTTERKSKIMALIGRFETAISG
ncbi:hypothetical protein ABZP36_024042 [Zizania latifolia]